MGLQVLPGVCSSVGFPRGCSCLQESTCTAVVSSIVCRTSMGYGGTAASPWSVPGATGKSLLQYTPPAPPSPLTLMPAKVFFSRILTPFYCCCSAGFFSLFKHIVPEELSSHWGSALAIGEFILEPSGPGSLGCRESFWQILKEVIPIAPLLPKPCHANPVSITVISLSQFKHLILFWWLLCSLVFDGVLDILKLTDLPQSLKLRNLSLSN